MWHMCEIMCLLTCIFNSVLMAGLASGTKMLGWGCGNIQCYVCLCVWEVSVTVCTATRGSPRVDVNTGSFLLWTNHQCCRFSLVSHFLTPRPNLHIIFLPKKLNQWRGGVSLWTIWGLPPHACKSNIWTVPIRLPTKRFYVFSSLCAKPPGIW